MRALFIGLLVAVGLLLLAGVAVLPNLFNPDDYRADIAAGVEALTGREVRLDGRIDLGLLPRPTLSVAQASLANPPDADAEAFRLTVERIDLHLAMWPLLRGELRVTEALLVRPVLTLERPPERPFDLLASGGAGADGPPLAARLRGVVVADGELIVTDDPGAVAGRRIDRINADLSIDSAAGPFILAADFRDESGRLFSLAGQLGRLDQRRNGALQLELAGQGPDGSTVAASYRGLARFGPEGPELRGTLAVEGNDFERGIRLLHALARADDEGPGGAGGSPPGRGPFGDPFAVGGRLELTPVALTLGELALRLGASEASGDLTLGLAATEPRLELNLRVPQLTLAELPPGASNPASWPAAPSGLSGAITVTVDTLTARDDTIRRLRLGLTLPGDGRVAVDRASAVLPGGTDISFTGTFETADGDDGAPLLAGSLEAASDNLRALLDWLGLDTSAVPPGRLRTLSFTGDVALSPLLLKLVRGELRFDASTLAGSLAVGLGPRRRLAMAASLDRLNADAYLPPEEPAGHSRDEAEAPAGTPATASSWLPEAWREAALAFDAALDLRVERLTWAEQRLQDVHLRGRLEEGLVTLDELAIVNLAELRVHLEGQADLQRESVDVAFTVETEQPARALRLLGYDPPPALAAFAPVRLDGTADGPLAGAAIELDLSAADLELGLSGEAGGWPAAVRLNVAWQARHPDLPGLLRQIGVPEVPERALTGPIQLAGGLDLTPDAAFEARFAGTLGPMAADGWLAWEDREPRPWLSLNVSAEPLVGELLTVLAAAGTSGRGNAFTPGNLSRRPLDADALGQLDLDLELTTTDMRYGGQSIGPIGVTAALQDRTLDLSRFTARPFGGALDARVRLAAAEGEPLTLDVDLELDGVEAGAVLERFDLPPALQGPTDIRLTATTAGPSAFDLIGGLNGELELRVRKGRLSGVDFAPVRRVLTENGPERPNMARVRQNLLGGETPFAYFGGLVALRRGVLHTTELGAVLEESGVATVEGAIDLVFWACDLMLELRPDGTGADGLPTVGLRIVGPLNNPQTVPRLDDLSAYFATAAEQATDTAAPGDAGAAPRLQPDGASEPAGNVPQESDSPPQETDTLPRDSAAPPGE